MSEYVQLSPKDGTSMQAYTAIPAQGNGPTDSGASCGVIVIQEAFGVNHYIRGIADRFAKEGYLSIAPELFHRTAPPGFETPYTAMDRSHMGALTDEGIAADLAAAYEWLVRQKAEKIAAVGFCMGGRAAFLADATLPLAAAVSFYGGGIAQTLLPRAKDLRAPILLLWGGFDKHISATDRRAVLDALDAAGKPYAHVLWSDADHGFFCDERASFSPSASAQALPLTLAFLRTHLGI